MIKNLPKVSIIILNWNQKETTLNCLKSLEKINYSPYEIIIVDNASTDNSVSSIKRKFPESKIIENQKNLGVAGGRNVGIKYALQNSPDYLLLLDNDTTVHKDFITEMVKVGESDKKIGILTAKIFFHSPPNRIWCAGGKLDFYRCKLSLIGYNEIENGQYNTIKEVDHVAGCCLMIKKIVINEIGILDQNFIQYFSEDTDWCIRAKKKGYKIIYVPKAKIWHHVTKKTTVSGRYWFLKGRNLAWLMRKHARFYHWIVFSLYFILGVIKVIFREAKAGNLKHFLIMAKGTLTAFKIKKR